MEYTNYSRSASWSERVVETITIMANVVTIAVGIGKLFKLLRGRKEVQITRR